MLPPPRRWIRDKQPSSSVAFVRRWLCSRRPSLWILLILLVVFVAIQTFVARQARNDKLMFSVNKEFSTLDKGWAVPQYESSAGVKQHMKASHHHQDEDSFDKNVGGRLDKKLNLTAESETEAKRVPPDHLHEPKLGNELNVGLPGSLSTHNARKDINGAANRILNQTHPFITESVCTPNSHVVFLKTHKTASSTILNILYRYGDSRNLTFALPLNKHSQLFYPFFFSSHFVEGFSSGRLADFHIMCNHMRFRKSEVSKVMPPDTFYFSILRHPVTMMESIFIYFKSIPAFQKTPSLDKFLDSSWKNFNFSVNNNHYAHNVLAFDFGFDNNVTAATKDLENRVAAAIEGIERDFNLILISEYFEESMILLRRALCWSLEDVASFRLNSRSEKTRRSLSPETAEKIKQWNALDWRIYLHFNATFWQKVDTLIGRENLKREVSELREIQAKLANTCLQDGRAVDPSQVKDAGLKPFQYGAAVIQGYNLKPNLDRDAKTKCERFITPELQYTEHLYFKQFPDAVGRFPPAKAQKPANSGRTAVIEMLRKRVGHHKPIVRNSHPKHRKAPVATHTTPTDDEDETNMP